MAISVDESGRRWRTAVEVELTPKTRARVEDILRVLLADYDDVLYLAVEPAAPVVADAAESLGAAERVLVRRYPLAGPLGAVA